MESGTSFFCVRIVNLPAGKCGRVVNARGLLGENDAANSRVGRVRGGSTRSQDGASAAVRPPWLGVHAIDVGCRPRNGAQRLLLCLDLAA